MFIVHNKDIGPMGEYFNKKSLFFPTLQKDNA